MEIVIEQVPEELVPEQLQREDTRMDTLEEAQLNAAMSASALEQPEQPKQSEEPEPPPKRRGRPVGSKNKPKIIEHIPEEPIVLNEPPEPKKPAPRKPRAAKATTPPIPPPTPAAPVPQTPLQVAASMLEILRLEQAERQYRRGEMYKSWVK